MAEEMEKYVWMVAVGITAGFIMAFGIGANDVANAFGSSVAARSLSLGQAIVIASIFEFSGAVLMGQSVSGTIRGEIVDPAFYKEQPEIFMFGMLSALIISGIWLLTATAWELPVSTTHTIVAGIVGFSVAAEGFESVKWDMASKIFMSWFISPTLTGIVSFIFFGTVKKVVLEAENTFERAMKTFPVVIFVGVTVNCYFILTKGEKKISEKHDIEEYGHRVVLPASLGLGTLCALVFLFLVEPWLKQKVMREQLEHEEALAREAELKANEDAAKEVEATKELSDTENVVGNDTDSDDQAVDASAKAPEKKIRMSAHDAWNVFAENTYKQDIHAISLGEDKRAREIWENNDAADPQTERLFSYLQVFTACLASFAHGSNDVANAIAPVSAIIDIYQHGKLNKKAEVEKWLLAMGGLAICLGFTLYGYKIIKAVGFKLTCMTPSRGFCIELASALAVSLASFFELPVSSTQ